MIGRNIAREDQRLLVQLWSGAGHVIGNHTYSHRRYSRVGFDAFTADVQAGEAPLRELPQFRKWLRFPVLDEGATVELRDVESTPEALPAGQSLVWAIAKATGRYEDILCYPAEDGVYEAPTMDALGL